MLDVFNIAKPQNCDIQIFYGKPATGVLASNAGQHSWSKPRGVSNIYMLLIGAGGTGDGVTGGGSGATTVWYGAAQNVPDQLVVYPGFSNNTGNYTFVGSKQTQSSATVVSTTALLTAQPGSGSTAGPAMGANQFANSGFFASYVGQAGSSGARTVSPSTFLSGGGSTAGVSSNYGYSIANESGFFIMQPIIVGVGGAGSNRGGIGCGGGVNGNGGPGMVLIASW